MSTHIAKLFTEDDRAIAPIIGFILLFGMLTVAFAGYQAEYVPQQNAETEFQHYQDVRNDLIVVRNAISRAGQRNRSQFESVQLGTQYRERALALNPPNPAGTLRTSEEYNITLDNGTTKTNVSTRFIKYQNGYNELDINPIYYENSVLYLNSSESGQRVFFEDQNLVQDNGDTVVITALQREFSRSAVGRITVELYPTDSGNPLPAGDEFEITLPTQLPETYWRDQLQGERPISNFGYDGTEDPNQVSFNVSSKDLEFNTVGINDEPDQGEAVSDIGSGGGGSGGGGSGGGGSGGGGSGDAKSVYYEKSGPVSVVNGDGTVTEYTPDSEVAIGLSRVTNVDTSDNDNEVVYVDDNNNLLITSPNGASTTLVNSGNVRPGNIGIGDWDSDPATEIFYVNNNKLYQYEIDGTSSVIKSGKNQQDIKAQAVAGVGDFDADDEIEVIYVANNGKIAYISNGGQEEGIKHKPSTVTAVSQPADFDNDTNLEIAYANGNNGNIETVDHNGNSEIISTVNVLESPFGAVDWNGDGTADIVYADSNNQELLYYDMEGTDGSTYILSNGRITIAKKAGTS